MEKRSSGLGEWLKAKCAEEGISLRQVATKVGVSHQTIAGVMNGKEALPQTIKKLARAFGGDHHQLIALEDKLLVLVGYRSERPGEAPSEAFGWLMDKVQKFDEPRLKIMGQFADFVSEIDGEGNNGC